MKEARNESPSSDVFSDGMDSLSMRDKSLIKRSVSKHHNNNFTAGYVPVHEQHLQKTGLRGRKTFAFWTLVGLLFVLAIGNLTLTMTILGVLRLGQGMQSLELVPEQSAIKLFGNADLNDIYKRDGRIEGFKDYPVDITGYNSSLHIKLSGKNERAFNKLIMDRNGTTIRNTKVFRVKNDNKLVFSTDSPTFNIEKPVNNLRAKATHASRVVSPIGSDLQFEGHRINLKGAEGTAMEGSTISMTADDDITLKSLNGSIILTSAGGIHVDTKKLPIYIPKFANSKPINLQYKLCVCMPQGNLFKIPVTKDNDRVFCNNINISQFNPCAQKFF
ncbi:PREDICTED: beta-sarcoglycan [Nicrophorus vespilloides]|uniref:Beta-sarcoglycan n=1 Tax=Nicrophorus vespilloides TaxID=110193 RepID=A0ABM1MCU7_NICVS|nr:PREDICTED: beta-sarcoglycan [Nicrophorus vespilloides]